MYQGTKPFSVALLIDSVQMELVYPSQLQLSCSGVFKWLELFG